MPRAHNTDYSPAWLDEYADRLANNDQGMEAVAFRQMAQMWSADRRELQEAQQGASDLQRRLDRIVFIGSPPSVFQAPAVKA